MGDERRMNREFLKRLYWACTDDGRHQAVGRNLGELYEFDGACDAAFDNFTDYAVKIIPSNDALYELERLAVEIARAYELQGFTNGFRLGMLLTAELNSIKEAAAGEGSTDDSK